MRRRTSWEEPGGLGDGERERDLRPADITDSARSNVLGFGGVEERLGRGESEGVITGLPITGELAVELLFVDDLRPEEALLEVEERPIAGGNVLNQVDRKEGDTGIMIKE